MRSDPTHKETVHVSKRNDVAKDDVDADMEATNIDILKKITHRILQL